MRCELCGETGPDEDVLEHFRLMHPEVDAHTLVRWPDGRPVILDRTLEPQVFDQDKEIP